jgi:hypothetical protein
MEDDVEVKKAIDEAQGKREWVEWAGKTLMPPMHAQIAMEKADEKGKWKAVPSRAKVYAEVDGPVSNLTCCRQSALM